MYLDDGKLVFCTLAIGELYRHRVSTQIQSILKFTHHTVYVLTDSPEWFRNYYGERVKLIDIATVNFKPWGITDAVGRFNYNLKIWPIKWVAENTNAQMIVYMDADSFLFGWDRLTYRYFLDDSGKSAMFGRFRSNLNNNDFPEVKKKAETLEINISEMDTQLPIENIMFFRNCGNDLKVFINKWEELADITITKGQTCFFEAVELAIALNLTNMKYVHVDQGFPYSDNFRTLHNGEIHVPFVI
jgi:hypothetical protein